MPYTLQEERCKFDQALNEIASVFATYDIGPGDLNYLISSIVVLFLESKKKTSVIRDPRFYGGGLSFNFSPEGLSYGTLFIPIGVLQDAMLEYRRRVVEPYEDIKIEENGDIYS